MENKNKQSDNHIEYFAHKIAWVVLVLLLLELIFASAALWKVRLQISKDLSIGLMPIHKQMAKVPADWKTYTNSEYGFSFEYPKDWKFDGPDISYSGSMPKGVSITLTSPTAPEYPQSGYGTVNLDINDYSGSLKGCVTSQSCISEERTISGNKWLVETFVQGDGEGAGSKLKTAEIIKDGKRYLLHTGCCGLPRTETLTNLAHNNSDLDKILSTFKFISTTTADASTWKTYTNDQYGFQLAFPAVWKGYKVFSYEGGQGVGHPEYYQFSMSTSDKTKCVISVTDEVCGYASVFNITLNFFDEKPENVLTKADGVIYSYYVKNNLPADLKNIDFEIPKVISTFKLTGTATAPDNCLTRGECMLNNQ